MATPKVLTITLKFEMGDRKIHYSRIKAASDAAVQAGTQAVQEALLDGSVDHVTATTTWAYHWAEFSTTVDEGVLSEDDEDEEE